MSSSASSRAPPTGAERCPDDCPSDSTFAGLVEGTLDEARLRALQTHASTCVACSRTLAELARTIVPDLGDWLDGRYRLLAPLGAGGMGIVYEAFDTKLRRKVAVKRLRDAGGGASLERRRARFLREARLLASLSHPNVLTVHDVGSIDGEIYVVMELVDGQPMSRWIADVSTPLGWREIVDLYLEAGRGLSAAHRLDVVHRDVKPENILVARNGRVLIGDFGLAGLTETGEAAAAAAGLPSGLTETGTVLGTPAYMAPEVHDGHPGDARADQFSFCTSLYESLHARRPFPGRTVEEIGVAIRRGGLPLGSDGVPSAVDRVIARGLRANPTQRHASMEDLLAALVRARDGFRIPRRPTVGAFALVAVVVTAFVLRERGPAVHTPLSRTEPPLAAPTSRASGRTPGATATAPTTSSSTSSPREQPLAPATSSQRSAPSKLGGNAKTTASKLVLHPATHVPQGADPRLLLLLADDAYAERDGAACLTALSRMPSDAWPNVLAARAMRRHATCEMLAGGCEAGRRLLVSVDGADGARRAMLANCRPDDLPTVEDRLLAIAEQADEGRYGGTGSVRRQDLKQALMSQMESRGIHLCLENPTASRVCGRRLASLARAFQSVAEAFLAAGECGDGAVLDVLHSQVRQRSLGTGEGDPIIGCRAKRTFEVYKTCDSEGHQAEELCVARARAAPPLGATSRP